MATDRHDLTQSRLRKQSIKLRMLAIVLAAACSTQLAIASILTLWGIWASEEQSERRSLAMLQSRAEIVAGLVWRFEYDELNKIVKDILHDNSIAAIRIFDDGGQIATQFGDKLAPLALDRTTIKIPLHYKSGIVDADAGVLEATIRTVPFVSKYGQRLLEAGLLALFSTAAIIIAIWTAMTQLVNRPLDRLLHAIEQSRRTGARVDVHWDRKDEIGMVIHAFNAMQVTDENAQQEIVTANARLHRLTELDDLTGLRNRRAAQREVKALTKTGSLAIHFIDLDEFRVVNDSLGHGAGDTLLLAVGTTLTALSSEQVEFFRIGGDEFIALQTNARSGEDVLRFANQVHSKLNRTFHLGNNTHHLKLSIGSFFSNNGIENGDELFGLADTALHEAKRLGRNRVILLTDEMRQQAVDRLELEKDLLEAVRYNTLEARFQPQLDLRTGEVVGFETLSRWTHPVRGPISPEEFIPLIASMGLSVEHGRGMIRAACKAAAEIRHEFGRNYGVAVNINTEQLANDSFIALLMSEIGRHKLAPSMIELEITESELIQNFEQANSVIRELRATGISVAIDDFGTGYSSLSYLSKLQVDRIKIDRSFIQRLTLEKTARPLVELIAGVARTLSLSVVAEGIENEAEEAILRGCGVHYVQGFLYAKPMPLEALKEFMRHTADATPAKPRDRAKA